MDYGFVLDHTFELSWEQQRELARLASGLGYQSGWGPGSANARDGFHAAVQWAQAAPGLTTGISVITAPFWTPVTLADQAATVAEITDGRFILGISSGGAYQASVQQSYDMPARPVISLMRDYLKILRGLLDGEEVNYTGKAMSLHGVKLGFRHPKVPLYVGALGPQMVKLAGELADGVIPSWSSPEQVAWGKERTAEAARNVGRDPSEVKWVGFVRMVIDEDADVARRTFAASLLRYGLARPGAAKTEGYRGHFGRMGFEEVLSKMEERRDKGTPVSEMIDDLPTELMEKVGYFGTPAGAPAAFNRLAKGLDTALLRMITSAPGPEKVALALESVRPSLVTAA